VLGVVGCGLARGGAGLGYIRHVVDVGGQILLVVKCKYLEKKISFELCVGR
jgi:hypothetical protein